MKKNLILITLYIIISCGSGSSSDQVKSAVSEKQSHANDVIANKKIPKTNVATKSVIEKNIANLAKSKKISSQKRNRKSVKDAKLKQVNKQKSKNNVSKSSDKIRAPDFLLSDLDGNIFDLSAFSGQVIMLTFWGTWCGPCRREIPDFIRLYDEFNSSGLEIIGVAVQSGKPDAIKRFTDYYGINYTILTDIDSYESYKAFNDYGRVTGVGTRAVPTTFIIDREGYIVKTYRGARPGSVFYQDLKPYL